MYMHCSYLFYWQLGVVNGGLRWLFETYVGFQSVIGSCSM